MTKLTGSSIDLLGTYGVCFDGFVIGPSGLIPLAAVGWMHADGHGKLTVKRTTNVNGTVPPEPPLPPITISGTYQVYPDGTGTAILNIPNQGNPDNPILATREHYSFVINSDNSEVQFISTAIRSPSTPRSPLVGLFEVWEENSTRDRRGGARPQVPRRHPARELERTHELTRAIEMNAFGTSSPSDLARRPRPVRAAHRRPPAPRPVPRAR
jgi:hypothetical protein